MLDHVYTTEDIDTNDLSPCPAELLLVAQKPVNVAHS